MDWARPKPTFGTMFSIDMKQPKLQTYRPGPGWHLDPKLKDLLRMSQDVYKHSTVVLIYLYTKKSQNRNNHHGILKASHKKHAVSTKTT